MKRIFIVAFVTIILSLVVIHFGRRWSEDSEFATKFRVYIDQSNNPIDRLFRRIPTSYDKMIKITLVDPSSKEINLYRVDNDIFGGTPDIHYLVYDKDHSSVSYLKSSFLFRRLDEGVDIDLDTIDAYSIELNTFNKVFAPHLKTPESVADKYAELLANSTDSLSFRRITHESEITEIRNMLPANQEPMIDSTRTLTEFGFISELSEDEFIFWYYDKGLLKLTVQVTDGTLIKARTKRIGNLGVEITHF
jgi:hypothetical protein